MICEVCGSEIPAGCSACPVCGTVVPAQPEPVVEQPQAPQPQYQAPQTQQPQTQVKNSVGLAAFILAISSIVLDLALGFIGAGWVASAVGLAGFICSIVGMVKRKNCNTWNGFALAALIISLAGIVLSFLLIFVVAALIIGAGSGMMA